MTKSLKLPDSTYTDCPDCKCPREWHSQFTGHCYGCNKDCPSQKREDINTLPLEIILGA